MRNPHKIALTFWVIVAVVFFVVVVGGLALANPVAGIVGGIFLLLIADQKLKEPPKG